jgi:hypothetical protein
MVTHHRADKLEQLAEIARLLANETTDAEQRGYYLGLAAAWRSVAAYLGSGSHRTKPHKLSSRRRKK